MQKRLLRTPLAALLGGLTTYAINRTIMRPVYENDLKELGLDKYYELDLDADMMRQDLRQMKIVRVNEIEDDMQSQQNVVKESKH